MKRRSAALLAIAVLAGPAKAASPDPRPQGSWIARRLETGLSAAFSGTVRIGGIDVDWTSLTATVSDVSISIPAEGAPPLTATLAKGRIQLAWSGLTGLAAGDIRITNVTASGATFSCSREWIDAFRPKPEESGHHVAIEIGRLDLLDSQAEYVDAGNHTRVQASALSFHGDWSTSRRLLVGETQADVSVDAPLFGRTWPAKVRGGLRWGGGRLEIFNAVGDGPGAHGELRGNVTWGAGASFTAEGRASTDLAAMSPYLAGALSLSGTAEGPVSIVFAAGAPIRVVVQAATRGLRIGPIVTEHASGELTVRPGRLDVARIDARAYDGAFTGSVGLEFGNPARLTTDLRGKGADLARLIALAGTKLPIAASADVTFAIEGEPGHPATWSGGGTFDAAPRAGDGIPAGGRGTLTFASGHARVRADGIAVAEAVLTLDLDAGLQDPAAPLQLRVEGSTTEAGATQEAVLRLLAAVGVPENRYTREPVTGQGRFSAAVETRQHRSVLDLSLDLTDGSYSGEAFETAGLTLHAGPEQIDLARIDVTGDGTIASGHVRFDAVSGDLDDVELTARDVSIARVLARMGRPATASGRADLTLRGFRDASGFAAQGELRAHRLIVGREILDNVATPVRIEGERVILEGVELRANGLRAQARVIYDVSEKRALVDALDARIDLASDRTLAEAGLLASGSLDVHGSFEVGPDGPDGLLLLSGEGLVVDPGRSGVRAIRLGDLEGTGELSPRGLAVAVRSEPEAAWTLEGFLGFADTLPLSAVLYFEDLVVGAAGTFGEAVDFRLKGQIQAEGDLTAPRAMEVNGALDEVALRLGPRALRSTEPFPLRLDAGVFKVGPARFQGEGADVTVAASGGIEQGDVSGYLRGTLDLAIASSFWSEIRGSGPVDVDATLGGTIDRPDLQGHITVREGRLRVIGYPQSLESIEADARFSGQTLTLESFHAFEGGGEIQASGSVQFSGIVPASFRAVFEGTNVTAKYPLGFKGTYDGRITLEGTPKHATISGRIDVVRGIYSKDFDVGLFGAGHREFDSAAESPLPRNVALDVDIVAPGNVLLRNDLARLEASGQIHIGGELTRPEITGRIALVPGGTVRYRDVDYTVDYGTLDQTDPKRINPYVEFRGRTRVSDYEIALRVEGTLDKFEYELTSTPPLASQDIISLLVTGRTLDTLSGAASAAALPGDMAAYYFAGLLNSAFGKQIQNSLGIDQLEITPLLIKGASDPTARVTVGKRVSDKVRIAFSQDIGTAQKQTYQVAWDVSRRVRLIAESDTQAGFGSDVQYSRQFGGTPPALRESVAPKTAGGETGPVQTVSSIRVETDEGAVRADLAKKSKIKVGSVFDRGRLLQGADGIRAALVREGYIEATVRADAVSDEANPSTMGILYRIVAGPKVDVEIVMTGGGGTRSLKKALRQFAGETPYTADFWDEAVHALLEQLQQDGYYAADVTWRGSDDPKGRSVRILVDRGKPVRLKAIRFHGNVAMPTLRLEKTMSSLKAKSLGKRLLRPAVLTADLGAVRALYRDEGYARVRIQPPQITLAATGDSAEVDVTLEEGQRFTIGAISFSGSQAVPEEQMRAWLEIGSGDTFSPRKLAEAEQTLRDRLDGLGYPDVSVESEVGFNDETVDIAFDVVSGERKTVDRIDIAGNRVTKRRTIAQALTFGQGDLVSKQAFVKSQQQLYRTGLFSNVRFTAAPAPGGSPSEQTVTVKVEEAPPFALGLGAGYDSEEGPRASLLLGYSNLGGRNVGVTFQSRFSSKNNQELLTFRRRRVFGNTIDSLASILYEKHEESFFTQTSRSISFRFEQRPKPRWIRYLRYGIQKVDIFDITDVQGALEQVFKDKLSAIRLASVGAGVVRDTRDDAFLPTHGGYGSIEGSTFAKPLGSDETFVKLFVRGSWTITLKHRNAYAVFLRIGAAYPFAGTELVPLSERFFAGGANTMRGFADDTVGGLVIDGFHAGGESLFLLNQEWHFPLWRSLRGELFLDAGNVYPTLQDFRPTDLRSSAGLGLRLDTPIGPIRVEYGWKLDRLPDESSGELIFAIGAVF